MGAGGGGCQAREPAARPWHCRAAVGFCYESVLLESSPISSASCSLTSSESEPGGGEGERKEESLRGCCHRLAREIVSENHPVAGIDSISGQDTLWSGGEGWLGGDEQRGELRPC